MWWRARSLKGWMTTAPWPVKGDAAVVRLCEWQSAHPTEAKSCAPFSSEGEAVAGAGGARSRMKAAKLTTAETISLAGPTRLAGLLGVWRFGLSPSVGVK